jgi:hypothetical protein
VFKRATMILDTILSPRLPRPKVWQRPRGEGENLDLANVFNAGTGRGF